MQNSVQISQRLNDFNFIPLKELRIKVKIRSVIRFQSKSTRLFSVYNDEIQPIKFKHLIEIGLVQKLSKIGYFGALSHHHFKAK